MTLALAAPPILAPPAAPTPGTDLGGPAEDIAYLRSCGLSMQAIRGESGVGTDTVADITAGRQRSVRERTVAALRVARLAWTPPPGQVLALPATRMLQALAYIGHAPTALAGRLAQPAVLVWDWTSGEYRFLPRAAAAAIEVLYRRLGVSEGPSVEVAGYARRQGWVSALAWDEGAIDDPWARPVRGRAGTDRIVDPVAVERALAGDAVVAARLTKPELRAAARLGTQRGLSAAVIGRLLYRTSRTVQRVRAATTLPIDLFVDYYAGGTA